MSDQRRSLPLPAIVPTIPESTLSAEDRGAATLSLKRARYLSTPAALAFLCLLTLTFFWKVIVLHRVLIPIDILYQMDPIWRTLAPPGFREAANPLDFDDVTQFYPWAQLATQAMHQGTLPLWNPYAFSGTPFLAAMQPAVLYPVNLLLAWLAPAKDIPGFRACTDMIVALTGTFFFARRLNLSRPAALMAAIAFSLSLPYIVWLEHPISTAVAWLPWMLLCIEGAMRMKGRLWWLVATAGVFALEMLAGHVESTAHVLLLCGAYALFRVILAYYAKAKPALVIQPLMVLAGGAVLGLAIAAAQVLPILVQLPGSEEVNHRNLIAHVQLFSPLGSPANWVTLVLALVPNFYGNPTWHETLMPLFDLNYHETALYIGSIPLLLALLVLVRHRTPYTVFFGCAALVALGMALRLPFFSLINYFPVLRVLSNGRLRLEYAFSVSVLAGYGLDVLCRDALKNLSWQLIGLWLVIVAALSSVASWMLHAFPNGLALLQAYPILREAALRLAGLHIASNDSRLHPPTGVHALSLLSALSATTPALWLALFVGSLWLCKRRIIGTTRLKYIALSLTAIDLLVSGSGYHTTASVAQASAIPPVVRALHRDHTLYRVVGVGNALLPSTSNLFRLQDIRGYDPAYSADYERYFAAAFSASGATLTLPTRALSQSAATRALDLMNVKYIIAPCSTPINAHVYPIIYRGSDCVYRNPTVMPRAMLVHRIRWSTPMRATVMLADGSINPRYIALIDPNTVRGAVWNSLSVQGTSRADKVQVTSYGLDSVDLMVHSTQSGVIVLSDTYAPGWSAQVDGRTAPIARADAVFRAVAVGPGTHHVHFSYRPAAFTLGITISGIAVSLWLLILLGCVCRSILDSRLHILTHLRRRPAS